MKSILNLKDFDFHLPESLIAQKPLADRDQSKLMILDRNSGSIKHEIFKNLPHFISPQSLMVFNNTKVVMLTHNQKLSSKTFLKLLKFTF